MRNTALWLAFATLLLFGCAQHSKAWDDAWAQCQAEAFETWTQAVTSPTISAGSGCRTTPTIA